MTPRRFAISFGVFAITTLAIVWPSLDYYWNWDDLHLLRPFSGNELVTVLTDHWAASRFETLGLRPFTTWFNFVRWVVFQEHLVAHRVFLVGLMATYLSLLAWLACRLGVDWWMTIVAGVIAIAAKNNYYHVAWITDGIRLFQGLLLTGLQRERWSLLAASVAVMAVALLTREDSLAFFVILPSVAVFQARRSSRLPAWWSPIARYTMALGCVWFLIWLWRLAAVPNAPQFKLALDAVGRLANMALWTIDLSGQQDAAGYLYWALFGAALGGVAWLDRDDRRLALFWLGLTLLAVLPGNVRAVPNLLLYAVSSYAMFLAFVLLTVSRRSRSAGLAIAAVLTAVVVSSARASRLEQLSLHPMSTGQMYRDWTFIYGDHRDAKVPAVRVDYLKDKLARQGITSSEFDFDRWNVDLRIQGRHRPDGERAFVPPRRFLRP